MKSILKLASLAAFLGCTVQGADQTNIITVTLPPWTGVGGSAPEKTVQFLTNQVVTVVGGFNTIWSSTAIVSPPAVQLEFANGDIVRNYIAGQFGPSVRSSAVELGNKFVGLTKMTLRGVDTTGHAITLAVSTPGSEPTSVPSGTVVIPTDATGPVRIILESSTDLVTWTEANPGTYGRDNPKRFFRVRAVNQ
jgi:hypothetical protein